MTMIRNALIFLLDHLPPRMHLVITSRADPSLPLSRLRARGQMTEIRADDLRFTTEETTAFLNEVTGLDLPEKNVAALKARTEGWVAGLQLTALSMQSQDATQVSSFITAFSGNDRTSSATWSMKFYSNDLKVLRSSYPPVRLAASWTRLHVAQGNLAVAGRWAEKSDLRIDYDPSYLFEIDHLTLVRVLKANRCPSCCVKPRLRALCRTTSASS